ncbi:hypothetical protein V8B55DRAFT_1330595, partial [Mucor lusitanicus]
ATFPVLKSEDTLFAIPIFHVYAHNIHCQLHSNPRYIAGFGLTDGEGTERLWSYLNQFASMTRSMSSSNRHLVLTDAVLHYSEKKVELLTYPGKKVSGVHEAVVGDLTSRADPIFLYIDLVSRYLALDMCHTRRNTTQKEELKKAIEEMEEREDFDFARLTTVNHPFLRRYSDLVDRNVAVALKDYFMEMIKCCCLYESKRDACRGSAKAQKISLALDSFKKSAREAQSILQKHLNEKFERRLGECQPVEFVKMARRIQELSGSAWMTKVTLPIEPPNAQSVPVLVKQVYPIYALRLCQQCPENNGQDIVWNRDANAGLNMRTILTRYIVSNYDLASRPLEISRARRRQEDDEA